MQGRRSQPGKLQNVVLLEVETSSLEEWLVEKTLHNVRPTAG
jgi:hypothetical protein